MPLPEISVTLSPDRLSDLFSNFDHPELDAFYSHYANHNAGLPDDFNEQEHVALCKDANEFLFLLGIQNSELASALACDFLERR